MSDTELSALQRGVSTGSKLVVAGSGLAISSGLLSVLVRVGIKMGGIKPPGLPLQLPPSVAVVVLALASAGTSLAGWAFLRQARRRMRHLEFEVIVSADTIKSALSGSALISASTLLIRLLCVAAILSLYVAATLSPAVMGFAFGAGQLVHLVGVASVWIRWFNPDNWEAKKLASLIARLFLWRLDLGRSSLPAKTKALLHRSGVRPEQVFALEQGIRRIRSSLPTFLASGVFTVLRKGIGAESSELAELHWAPLTAAMDDLLRSVLPQASDDARRVLRDEFVGSLLYDVGR